MMFSVSLVSQYVVFIKSIGVGFFCGWLYGLPEIFLRGKNRILLAVKDILFFIIAGVLSFLFVLETNSGKCRFFIFAGEGIGASLFFAFPFPVLEAAVKNQRRNIQKLFLPNDKKVLHK